MPVDPMTSAFLLPLKAEDRSKLDGTGGMEPTADAGKEPGLLSDWTAETRGAKYDS